MIRTFIKGFEEGSKVHLICITTMINDDIENDIQTHIYTHTPVKFSLKFLHIHPIPFYKNSI